MYSRTINLDVTPGGEPQVIHISQYDAGARSLSFALFAGDAEFEIPSGAEAEINGTKPDGNGFSYEMTLEGSTATVTLAEQVAAVAGKVPCKIVLTKGNKKILSEKFILSVDRAALDLDTLSSESEIRQLVEIASHADELTAAAAAINGTAETVQGYAQEAAQAAQAAANGAASAGESAQDASDTLETVRTISGQIDQKKTDLDNDLDQAVQSIVGAKENAVEVINTKAAEVVAIRTNAENVAASALSKANNLENDFAEVQTSNENLLRAVREMQLMLSTKVDDGYADAQGYLHLTANGDDVSDPIGPFAGGSGGGSGGGGEVSNVSFSASNTTGWLSKTIAENGECTVSLTWSSIDNDLDLPTGNGTLQVLIGSVIKASVEVAQGPVSIDLKNYVTAGANTVTVRVMDIYGNYKRFNFIVSVVSLSLSSTFDTSATYDSAIIFPYTPVGAVSKTVYFYLDGTLAGTQTTAVSGRQMTWTIPAQSHGAHTLKVYFEADINGETVRSNELYFEFIYIEPLNDDVIITSSFNQDSVAQYSTIAIPYLVYDPNNLTAEVEIYSGQTLLSTLTVDRTRQSYNYRADKTGNNTIRLVSGGTEKTIAFDVTETEVDVEAETQSLALYLTSSGRSNNEAHPETWKSEIDGTEVSATLTGFNWSSDGWQDDDDGITCLRLAGDARVTIPYKPFENDIRRTGLTFEIEFATRNVLDYNAAILSCLNGGKGIYLKPQQAALMSEQTELSMPYKEGEHIRIAYSIGKRAEYRLIRSYINGIMTRAAQYPDDDDFAQVTPENISIGSNNCGIDIYNIRIYTNDLDSGQILDNWIADTQDGGLMLERYSRNQIYDDYRNVVIEKLPNDLPVMILTADELPQYKGDKKIISGSYTEPLNPSRSFTFTGCQANVQGTSSAPYYRKNFDLQFKGGFEMITSGHADAYKLRDTSIPTGRFVVKADVASSDSANNNVLVSLYNDLCPYKTPEMLADSRVRWGIDGIPIVVFWNDGNEIRFHGKYNFNFPKRFPAGMGYVV